MEGIRSFLKWWLGEISTVFSGRRGPTLALVMTEREIALVEAGAGADGPLGVAEIDAPDRRERIEALRSIAERRTGSTVDVELRLPRAQVLFTEIADLDSDEPEAVIRAAEKASGRPAEEIVYDRASAADATPQTLGVALRSTVDEALKYAREWGFHPVRVTSVEWPAVFPLGPELFVEPVQRKTDWRSRLPIFLGLLVLLIVAAAGARAMGFRSALADIETDRAARLSAPRHDRTELLRSLAHYSDAASSAVDARLDQLPMWSLLAELTTLLPDDVSLETVQVRDGVVTLDGTGYTLDVLIEEMDRSTVFAAPRIIRTSARGRDMARFEIAADIVARSPL